MCIDLSIMILDSPTDEKEGRLGTCKGVGFACVLCFGLCFWVQTILAQAINLNMHKAWLFATSFRAFQAFASTCPHTEGTHVALQGLRDEAGNFCSRASAEDPPRLADMCVSSKPYLSSTFSKGRVLPFLLPRYLCLPNSRPFMRHLWPRRMGPVYHLQEQQTFLHALGLS